MKCAIMQPTYIPWIGYFYLIDLVDKFIFYDDVQLEKSSWQLRNRIKTSQGELFLSIHRKIEQNNSLPLINETPLNYSKKWQEKHLKTISMAYKKISIF